MSALGHSRPINSAPVGANVRSYFNRRQNSVKSVRSLSAIRDQRTTANKIAIRSPRRHARVATAARWERALSRLVSQPPRPPAPRKRPVLKLADLTLLRINERPRPIRDLF